MAKGYRTLSDVAFQKPIAQISENDWAVEGVNYAAGSLIPEAHLTPFVRSEAEAGKLDHLLAPVEDDEFDQEFGYQQQGEPTTGVFIAEHEAEAHALRMGGHIVVPKDQALEAAAASTEHHGRYQKAAENAGLSHRPAQAAMAAAESEEGRVPDHWLEGSETRTGLPHNRGPVGQRQSESEEGYEEEPESGENQNSESDSESATRSRPPVAHVSQSDSEGGSESNQGE